jgi:AAA domain
MLDWPTGTVAFLFTDIEGSTPLAQQYPAALPALLKRHSQILRTSVEANDGRVYQSTGRCFRLRSPPSAPQSEPWDPVPVKVCIEQLLAGTWLLTLTGSGGAGKTRLALQGWGDLLQAYADGVWLAELAPLADPLLIPQAIASALGLRDESQRPLFETIREYLHGKQVLLILDNCEHLVEASARYADALLRGAPHLKILATSREPLAIAGETIYRVHSLRVPEPHAPPPVADLLDYEAVRLFIERAALALPWALRLPLLSTRMPPPSVVICSVMLCSVMPAGSVRLPPLLIIKLPPR